jgi:general stress protein YciG
MSSFYFFTGGSLTNYRIKEFSMAGTKAGGRAAAATNKAKYGADFYAKIGAQGGKKGHTGGFAANRELARIAGAKGGRISRRTKTAV